MHAQDKGVMRSRLAELGVPCPRNALVALGRRRRGVRLPVRAQDHPRRVRRQGRLVRVARPTSAPSRSRAAEATRRPPAGRGAGRLPPRAVGAGRPVAERPGGGVPGRRLDPARRHLPRGDRARARPRRRTWPAEAQQIALRIAGELDVTGILAVELFETTDGRVLVNELAMRPHNTGHWTQDGAVTSQFENHLRAVLDLPLGSPAPRARWTVMVNILGGPDDDRPPVRRLPARAGPRPAPAGAPLRQGAAPGPQGRPRQRVRRRPRRLPRARAARRRVVPGRPGQRERVTVSEHDRPRGHRDGVRLRLAGDEGRGRGARRSSTSPTRPTWSPRTGCPRRCSAYGREAAGRGLQVIIAGAGGAAHLPGMLAVGHAAAGDRRTGAAEVPRRHGLAALDRADAGRRPGRHGRGRQRPQRRPARRPHPGRRPTPACSRRMVDFQAELQDVGRGEGQGRPRRGGAGARKVGF